MKVKIDADACTGCGLCVDSVPDVFVMGDDIAEVIKAEVPEDLKEEVQEAAENCPVEAIIIE
ncbi:MAG: ferredoxin [Spirochaetales bacterium]|nr:ferredoxin [Spirochaetales bacterium]